MSRIYITGAICRSTKRLDGKEAIIAGANTGIGYETALEFAKRGARVILACRDIAKARLAANRIIQQTNNEKVEVGILDLADLKSIRQLAEGMNAKLTRLDLLVNNGGMQQRFLIEQIMSNGDTLKKRLSKINC